ncbi:MAG: metallophosphoesterase family protein [Candidatus Hodarchaeales archaeon]|jgi:exonuclease SbcD
MLRLLHTGDLHLGVRRIDRLNSDGQNVMVQDFFQILDEMVSYAIKIDSDGFPYIDAFLIAGDVFQHPNPSPTILQQFATAVQRLIEAKVQVVLIPGNHDKPITKTKSDPLQIFRILEVQGCQVFNKPELKVIKTNRGTIEVLGFPYISFKSLLGRDKYQGFSEEEIAKKYLSLIRATIEKHILNASSDRLTVFLAHMHVLGSKIGSERSLTMSTEPMIPPTSLIFDNCDYICLGHIHKHQIMYKQPPVVYSGSPQRCDFSEEKEEKGFIEIQWQDSNNIPQFFFRKTNARIYKTIKCDVSTSKNPTKSVLDHINDCSNLNNAVVRLQITCSKNQRIEEELIQNRLQEIGLFHLYPIEINRLTQIRSRAPGLTAQDSFEEAINQYLKTRHSDKETTDRLKSLALQYITQLVENEMEGY